MSDSKVSSTHSQVNDSGNRSTMELSSELGSREDEDDFVITDSLHRLRETLKEEIARQKRMLQILRDKCS